MKTLVCPECKGTNINVQMVELGSKGKRKGNGIGGNAYNAARGLAGIGTFGVAKLFMPKAKGKIKTKNQLAKMAICQSCGASWTVK